MTEDKLGFREWTAHYEKEQEADREKIAALADGLASVNQSVGRLTANVETLLENQKGMYSRLNRPVQWGVFVSGAAFVAVLLGLVTAPMKESINDIENQVAEEVQRNLKLHMMFVEEDRLHAVESAERSATNAANIEWLMSLEGRLNNRIHDRAFNAPSKPE